MYVYTTQWIAAVAFAGLFLAPFAHAGTNPVTITVTVTPSSFQPGQQPLMVSASLSGGAGTPTGFVKLNVDNVSSGPLIPISNGSAAFSIPDSALGVPYPSTLNNTGTHTIGVDYTGDVTYLAQGASTNAVKVTVTVSKQTSSVTLVASTGSAVFGEPVTLSATIPNSVAAPTGTVNFLDGSTLLGSAAVAGGTATFVTSSLPVGAHSITAVYSGDTTYTGSTSSAVAVTVNKANSRTVLARGFNGTALTLVATVTAVAPGTGTPSGTVRFLNGSTEVGTITLSAGTATLTIPGPGTYSAQYSGDAGFNGSSTSIQVAPSAVSMSVSATPNPAGIGQPVVLSATVGAAGSSGTPTGTVDFKDGSTLLGTATLAAGTASVTASFSVGGSHTVTAIYNGDAVFAAASGVTSVSVGGIASTVTVSATVNGQTVTLSAQIGPTPAAGVPAPTGQVVFREGSTTVGSATLTQAAASVTLNNVAPGTHTYTAQYSGDGNWAAASGTATANVAVSPLTIVTQSLPDATLGSNYTATIAASGGTGPYQWSVTGLPDGITAAPSGASVTLSGIPTVDGTSNLTVQVTGQSGSANAALALRVVIGPLTITTNSLPPAPLGLDYSAPLAASGGVPPYTWQLTGTAPDGLSVSAAGVVSGKFSALGTVTFNVQVKDSRGTTAGPKQISFFVSTTALTISTASLPGGSYNQPYAATVNASGGSAPYKWSGTLPNGLTIDAATGAISGTVSTAGSLTLAITVTDTSGASVTKPFSVAFAPPAAPPVTISGLNDTANPNAQEPIQLILGSAFPLAITGNLTLTFQADSGGDDLTVRFLNGTRTASFTVAANSTVGVFDQPGLALQTGTTAGTITLTAHLTVGGLDITPSPAPTKRVQVGAGSPSISSVTATRGAGGFTVQTTGFSTPREVTQAIFHFNAASGANLTTTDVTIPVTSVFAGWFQSSAVSTYGSQFLFTQNFTVQGDTPAVASVSVTLVNSKGNSVQTTATIQ